LGAWFNLQSEICNLKWIEGFTGGRTTAGWIFDN